MFQIFICKPIVNALIKLKAINITYKPMKFELMYRLISNVLGGYVATDILLQHIKSGIAKLEDGLKFYCFRNFGCRIYILTINSMIINNLFSGYHRKLPINRNIGDYYWVRLLIRKYIGSILKFFLY